MTGTIQFAVAPDGTALHLVAISADRLPRVEKRDLERVWETAHEAARAGQPGPRRGFRFAGGTDVLVQDRDARAWASSIDVVAGLSTEHGVSLCLRLIGLVSLITEARWITPFVRIRHGKVALDATLLHAASMTRLTESGNLDADAIRALLCRGDTEEKSPCSG